MQTVAHQDDYLMFRMLQIHIVVLRECAAEFPDDILGVDVLHHPLESLTADSE